MSTNFKRGSFWNIFCLVVLPAILLSCTVLAPASRGQSQPSLQISSPADGTLVAPGQTITINVTSPAGATFTQVTVIGEDPLPATGISSSLPAQFSIVIPLVSSARKYQVTAIGESSTGQLAASQPIAIDVERSDLPTALSVDRSNVLFQSQGQQTQFQISATFSDGTVLDVTESSNIVFTSNNTSVASVNSNGIITGVGAGTTTIVTTYSQGGSNLQATISVNVPSPVLTSSPASLSFGNQLVGTSSSSQSLSVTNSSKNQGLKISAVSTTGDFSETDNCVSSTALPVGGSCTVNVAFVPSATGSRSGTINITNSFSIVPIAVPLTGTGTTATPAISSLSPNSGAVGSSVTISGSNFGSPQGSSTVSFNGTSATPTSWSNTSISVPVPSGATTGNVVVTVGGAASNGVTFTVQGTTNGIVFVQAEDIDIANASTGSVTFPANNAAGNWIGVCIRAGRSNEVFTVTDSRGNTYRQAVQFVDTLDAPNGDTIAIFYAENISSGPNTVTVSDTISATLRFSVLEYTGVATENSLDVTAGAQGSSTSPNSGSATTTVNGDLLLGAIATADAATFSTPAGVTVREHTPDEPNTKLISEEQIQSVSGTAAAAATLAASDPWGAILASFKRAHP